MTSKINLRMARAVFAGISVKVILLRCAVVGISKGIIAQNKRLVTNSCTRVKLRRLPLRSFEGAGVIFIDFADGEGGAGVRLKRGLEPTPPETDTHMKLGAEGVLWR